MAAKVAEKTKAPSARELRNQVSNLARQLSPERLRIAVEFMEFLKEREERGTAWDILTDPKMMVMIRKAEADLKVRRMEAFIPWERVKRGEV